MSTTATAMLDRFESAVRDLAKHHDLALQGAARSAEFDETDFLFVHAPKRRTGTVTLSGHAIATINAGDRNALRDLMSHEMEGLRARMNASILAELLSDGRLTKGAVAEMVKLSPDKQQRVAGELATMLFAVIEKSPHAAELADMFAVKLMSLVPRLGNGSGR